MMKSRPRHHYYYQSRGGRTISTSVSSPVDFGVERNESLLLILLFVVLLERDGDLDTPRPLHSCMYGVAPVGAAPCYLSGSSIDDLNFNYMLKRSINDVNSESDLSI